MVPFANKQREEMSAAKHTPPSAIDRMTHEIINQLSIISLCSCELRTSAGEKLESDQHKELGRIEIAVQEAAELIQRLRANLQDHGPTVHDGKPAPALGQPGPKRPPVLSRSIFFRR
jgi:hypothetical protein